jgi:hypothetical protein
MTPAQFEAAAEPRLQPTWATPTWTGRRGASMRPGHRFMGLSRSVLPREIHFLLRCKGGPPDGYRVRVPEARPDLYEQPHRAFVEAALAEGLVVPSAAAADYNDLTSGPQDVRPSLDLPPDWANPLG